MLAVRPAGQDARKRATESEKLSAWVSAETPVKDLPLAEINELLRSYRDVFAEVEAGANCRVCDWGLDRRLDAEGIALLLPEVQGMREIANRLSLKARAEIAAGKTEDAVRTIRTGLMLARHACEGPTLIQALVGMALAAIFEARLEELVQRPDCPSLYWSLADLPRPFVDLRQPLQGELLMMDRTLPDLRELERGPMTPEQANRAMDDLVRKLSPFQEMKPDDLRAKMTVAGWVALGYPAGKKALVEEGMKAEDVEKMPAAQVVLLDSWGRYQRMRDEVFKWATLPYAEGRVGMQEALKAFREADTSRSPVLAVLGLLMPAVEKVVFAAARTDRRFAVLRCIEALRLHAASHDGKLPATLAEVTEVPVPGDPLTGRSFDYEFKDGKATLSAPPPGEPAHAGNSLRYEITLKAAP
jgi:hypothetical protein